ncbi:hypothetical protein [Mesomycoplasma lagogenitalium]|uniref:Uncharacterized protein n=1 Tax=Mesomycoplasma lagogenitalium TaxID=171286 RepID=A0ABY8LVW7_9BACT|nr:hypothetical protein [Mesomycoplasma lagogenitalium]WGI36297.1 hypothetical protein QEG99_02345 [Mesomycoplasma lagogenitalium]
MDNSFKNFCQAISFEFNDNFQNVVVDYVEYDKNSDFYLVNLSLNNPLDIWDFKKFYQKVQQSQIKFDLRIKYQNIDNLKEKIKDYFEYAYLLTNAVFEFLENKQYTIENNKMIIYTNDKKEVEEQKKHNFSKISFYLENWGFNKIEIKLEENKSINQDEGQIIKHNSHFKNEVDDDLYQNVLIEQVLNSDYFKVKVVGMIVDQQIIKNKSGLWIIILTITNNNHNIKVKTFAKTEKEKSEIQNYLNGLNVFVKGKYIQDNILNEKIISANKIKIIS